MRRSAARRTHPRAALQCARLRFISSRPVAAPPSPSAPPPASPLPPPDRWSELRRVLSSTPARGEDFGRRVRKLVRAGEEPAAVWAMRSPDAQAAVLSAIAPTPSQMAQFIGSVFRAHPSGEARTALTDFAPLLQHIGRAYNLEELRRAVASLPSQLQRIAPQSMQNIPEGADEWGSAEIWGSLFGRSVPHVLREDYTEITTSLMHLLTGPWARTTPSPRDPSKSLYSLRHASRLGTSALASFDTDWVNEEMFDSVRRLQNELAQHFHKLHPNEPFGSEEYAALLTDIVTLQVQKLERDGWTNMGYVNSLLQHMGGENVKGEVFTRFVYDVKLNLRGTLPQRISAYATDLLAPITGRPYKRPPVQLRSLC